MSSKKTILKTILYVLLIQIILAGSAIAFFYYNYEKFSKSKSGVSIKTNLKTIELSSKDISKKSENNKNVLYEGKLGYIKHNNVFDKKEGSFSGEEIYIFNINEDELKKISILNTLNNNKILDKYIYKHFYGLEKNIEEELTNFINFTILLNYKTKKEDIFKEIQKNYEKNLSSINEDIEKKEYKEMAGKLKNIENNFIKNINNIPTNIFAKNEILSDSRLQYIINKLYSESYYTNIQKVSEIFGVDKKLIISSIGVEQLRFLLTSRGYAKGLIKQNTYLTNFSKFSYGLGGIKVPTAREIQKQIKIDDINIYNKYFKADVGLSDKQIIEKLENNFGGTLYVGGLISNIKKRWEKAGISLKNKPGIIITLYNMGNPKNKVPNETPEMGGSILDINGNKLYFGEVGHLLYNYLVYYTNFEKKEKEEKEIKKVIDNKKQTEIKTEQKEKIEDNKSDTQIFIEQNEQNKKTLEELIKKREEEQIMKLKQKELLNQKIIERNKQKRENN